jgi:hypothetical protein
MLPIEMNIQVAQEQRRDWIAAAEQQAQAKAVCGLRPTLARRIAAPLGRVLLRLGGGLLRYGRAEAPSATRPYRASARSIRLN